ncbi:histone RNA hairpin-binding protein [Eurosta solidaginis]|uniref:histone RNA hairpin-binding protein n=1 Tax=Eurosta solidaginis TaxID=178769 RepID=UPI0035307D32
MLRNATSAERSPLRKSIGECSHNSSASSIMSFHGSWAQEVHNAEHDKSRRSSLNKSVEINNRNGQEIANDNDSSQEEVNTSKSAASQDREISLEFIEGVNEEKYERLLKEDKLKTPFKRRYSHTPSNDSRSDSPNDWNSDYGDGDGAGLDNDHCINENGNFKRSTNHSKCQYDAQKRSRYNSNGSHASSSRNRGEREDDPAILSRRQKQIEYGKNTLAYERYIEMVPRHQRTRDHPRTPDKFGKYSRRTFDGIVKVWRKQLHYYDPEPAAGTATGGANDDDTESD